MPFDNSLNTNGDNTENSQIGAYLQDAKNLADETTEKISVSQREKQKRTATEHIVKADIDLVITDYKQYIQKEHLVNDVTLSK